MTQEGLDSHVVLYNNILNKVIDEIMSDPRWEEYTNNNIYGFKKRINMVKKLYTRTIFKLRLDPLLKNDLGDKLFSRFGLFNLVLENKIIIPQIKSKERVIRDYDKFFKSYNYKDIKSISNSSRIVKGARVLIAVGFICLIFII